MMVYVRIKELCESRGISQRQLAIQAGIRIPSLTEINKRTTINKETIEKIAIALGIKDIREIIVLISEN